MFEDVSCQPLAEVDSTILCLFRDAATMRRSLARLSYFVEAKAHQKLADPTDPAFQKSPQFRYPGHDLYGKDILAFYSRADTACLKDLALCPTDSEQRMRNMLRTLPFTNEGHFVLLATSASNDDIIGTLTHELAHARFFLNPSYRG